MCSPGIKTLRRAFSALLTVTVLGWGATAHAAIDKFEWTYNFADLVGSILQDALLGGQEGEELVGDPIAHEGLVFKAGLMTLDGTQVGSEGFQAELTTQGADVALKVWGDPHVTELREELRAARTAYQDGNDPVTRTTADGTRTIRIKFKSFGRADCEEDSTPGDGGGAAMTEEISFNIVANLLVEVRYLDEGYAVRFPLRYAVCRGALVIATKLDRARLRRPFRRGALTEETPTLTDAVRIADHLFLGRTELDCLDAADVDDSGDIDITDVTGLLNYLFRGGTAPAEPFLEKGYGALESELDCAVGDVAPRSLIES